MTYGEGQNRKTEKWNGEKEKREKYKKQKNVRIETTEEKIHAIFWKGEEQRKKTLYFIEKLIKELREKQHIISIYVI